MAKRPKTPGFIFFYILFSPETWRILSGGILAVLLAPSIAPKELAGAGLWLFYIMLATIGYSVTAIPARALSRLIKKLVLGDRLPK